MTTCTHPSERLHAWFARDDTAPDSQVLCVTCSDCGAVLLGAVHSVPSFEDLSGPAWPSPTMAQPSFEELEEFEEDGGCLATDGCWVETDGTCPHGHPSWLLALGMI